MADMGQQVDSVSHKQQNNAAVLILGCRGTALARYAGGPSSNRTSGQNIPQDSVYSNVNVCKMPPPGQCIPEMKVSLIGVHVQFLEGGISQGRGLDH